MKTKRNPFTTGLLFLALLCWPGCLNKPVYGSGQGNRRKYQDLTCSQLTDELKAVSKQKDFYCQRQQRRIAASSVQVALVGFGMVDKKEIIEGLARTRGEKLALLKNYYAKGCQPPGIDMYQSWSRSPRINELWK